MKTYYYLVEGREHGPVSFEGLRQKIREGRITPGTRIWTEGMSDWYRADEILNLFPAAVSTVVPADEEVRPHWTGWQVSAAVLGAVLVGFLALVFLAFPGSLGEGGGDNRSSDDRWQQAFNDPIDG